MPSPADLIRTQEATDAAAEAQPQVTPSFLISKHTLRFLKLVLEVP